MRWPRYPLGALIAGFVRRPGCESGGPLRVVLMEREVHGSDLDYCATRLMSPGWDDKTARAGLTILRGLWPLDADERRRVIEEAFEA